MIRPMDSSAAIIILEPHVNSKNHTICEISCFSGIDTVRFPCYTVGWSGVGGFALMLSVVNVPIK